MGNTKENIPTTRSLRTYMCGKGRILIVGVEEEEEWRGRRGVRQARPFCPLMFIAQEPQIPSRQDLWTVRRGAADIPTKGERWIVAFDGHESIQHHFPSLSRDECVDCTILIRINDVSFHSRFAVPGGVVSVHIHKDVLLSDSHIWWQNTWPDCLTLILPLERHLVSLGANIAISMSRVMLWT